MHCKLINNYNCISSLHSVIFSLVLCFLPFISFQVMAVTYVSENQYYDSLIRKFNSKTLDELTLQANQGNADAQLLLGIGYLKGIENYMPINNDLAEKWLRQSAAAKNPYAELNLAYIELYTKNKPNLELIEHWLLNSAKSEVVEAQYTLANLYYDKFQNMKEQAFYWFHKAAKNGHIESAFNLGYMYLLGAGVEKDMPSSIYWFEVAAKNGNTEAIEKLGYFYLHGKGVKQNFYKANEYFQHSKNSILVTYQEDKGKLFENFKSYDYSLSWFIKAAQNGSVEAQYAVAKKYHYGVGTSKNNNEAVKWFTKAAENGHTESQYMLGDIYESGGQGILQDFKLAYKWFYRAAIFKNIYAPLRIATMYRDGKLGKEDLVKAHAWANVCTLRETENDGYYCRELMREMAENMSKKDVLKAQDLAKKLLNDINN